MANLITTTEELTSIADAIRAKTGESDLLEYPADFVEQIMALAPESQTAGIPYCVCETSKATAAKEVTVEGLEVETGSMLFVRFTYGNSSESTTFSVNGESGGFLLEPNSGASMIYPSIANQEIVLLMYNGQYWFMIFGTSHNLFNSSNLTVTNSISMQRKSGTNTGAQSIAAGKDTEASSENTAAFGLNTIAKGGQSIAFGVNNAENEAIPYYANNTDYVKGDVVIRKPSAQTLNYYIYVCTADHNSGTTFVSANWRQVQMGTTNSPSNANFPGKYVEMAGNGYGITRRNARTLDWGGNEVLDGNLTALGGRITIGSTTITEAQMQALLALLN